MFWTVHCTDKANTGNLRSTVLSAHLAYVGGAPIPVIVAGPLVSATGAPVGSLLIVEAEKRDDVEAFVKGAPFNVAGLWDTIRIDGFTPTKTGSFERPVPATMA